MSNSDEDSDEVVEETSEESDECPSLDISDAHLVMFNEIISHFGPDCDPESCMEMMLDIFHTLMVCHDSVRIVGVDKDGDQRIIEFDFAKSKTDAAASDTFQDDAFKKN